MKARALIVALLLLHLLVHPALHAFPVPSSGPVQAENVSGGEDSPSRLENVTCLTCRTAGYALATTAAGPAQRLPVSGESLPSHPTPEYSGLPGSAPGARAPPSAW